MIQRLKRAESKVVDAPMPGPGSGAPADGAVDAGEARRRMIAELCKVIGGMRGGKVELKAGSGPEATTGAEAPVAAGVDVADLAPRLRQTLDGLLGGASEKQVAGALGISPHTVHVYVKSLYRRFGVNSRGELLALFVRR